MLITRGNVEKQVSLSAAQEGIYRICHDFSTNTKADASRIIAAIITPALAMGGLLGDERAPALLCIADQSQAGKTYLQKCIAAVYGEVPYVVTRRKGGVGGMDESFSAGLLTGRPFIQIDNLRGDFDSEHIEAYLTAPAFNARVPHREETEVNTARFTVMLTSNGLNLTPDMQNRCSVVNLHKQPTAFEFTRFDEGDLCAHIKANQAHYLGCVLSVVRAWVNEGRPRTKEHRHNFRAWAQSLDWIVQNLFPETPALPGMVPLFQDSDVSAADALQTQAEEFADTMYGLS
jgi:hypothetical protein